MIHNLMLYIMISLPNAVKLYAMLVMEKFHVDNKPQASITDSNVEKRCNIMESKAKALLIYFMQQD